MHIDYNFFKSVYSYYSFVKTNSSGLNLPMSIKLSFVSRYEYLLATHHKLFQEWCNKESVKRTNGICTYIKKKYHLVHSKSDYNSN